MLHTHEVTGCKKIHMTPILSSIPLKGVKCLSMKMQGITLYIENDIWWYWNDLNNFEILFIYIYDLVYGKSNMFRSIRMIFWNDIAY